MKKANFKEASLLVSFSLLATGAMEAQQKTNVLFIIADDLNCYLGSYGHYLAQTPNIDQIASQGLLFENAYCNFPLCGPSRASMMTGLYPDQNNVKGNAILIRDRVPDVTTLTQVFMQNGYTATRIGKIYHYNNPKDIGTPGHDDPDSWSHTINPRGRDKEEEDKIFSLIPGRFGATLSWLAAEGTDEEQTDGIVATEAIKQIEKYAETEEPFFLAVGFYKPHTPYVAPKKYFDLYPRESIRIPRVPENYLETLPLPAREMLTRFKEQADLPDSLAISAIQAYLATISFMDAQVGRILKALDENGLKKNTIIVFTSDHGYHMGEHDYYQKRTLFEFSARIPLIISYPGQKSKGLATKSIVEMIDFYPTLCELANLDYPDYISGKSMLPVLENPGKKIRSEALTQTLSDGYSIITGKYRYIRWGEGGPGMIELYDKKTDPAEMINLANNSKYNKQIKVLNKKLEERVREAQIMPW
jgi:arylsulfatase A-like enzyme